MTASPYVVLDALPHICPNCGCGMLREGDLEREVKQLREQLATAERERDEARGAARWLWYAMPYKALSYLHTEAQERYPWIAIAQPEADMAAVTEQSMRHVIDGLKED